MEYSLAGEWQVKLWDDGVRTVILPGSLDENQIGNKDIGANQWHPDAELGNAEEEIAENAAIATRFTRKYCYEGPVTFKHIINFPINKEKRQFLYIERARVLTVMVNDKIITPYERCSLSTPQIFELTKHINNGDVLSIISDNSYPGLPYEDIVYSSAATDETQTNWNGLLGEIKIVEKEATYIEDVRVLSKGDSAYVEIIVDSLSESDGEIILKCQAFGDSEVVSREFKTASGKKKIIFEQVKYKKEIKKWDIDEPNLYQLNVSLITDGHEQKKSVYFGIRDFNYDKKGRLLLNNRVIFLLGETNCAEFPETGYEPMDVDLWLKIMKKYRDYGVNCVRFHSHCPPEAAFVAADKIGILMQPELSHWNPKNAFSSEESRRYYMDELVQIIKCYGNHPSFVMLTLGNELHADDEGHKYMSVLLNTAKELDPTRLYANGSNVHYGEIGGDSDSDIYEAQSFRGHTLRGTSAGNPSGENDPRRYTKEPIPIQGFINNEYPSEITDYSESLIAIRKEYEKPVIGFETGQFELLPDFYELADFKGISDPANYRIIMNKVIEAGLLPDWKSYVMATGELALICYRKEVEAALRTEGLSGTFLLGLQDFPGQGTALVGMLNSHLEEKPFDFAKAERFSAFFNDQLPLALLPKYTYDNDEMLEADIKFANYGKNDYSGNLILELEDKDGLICARESYENCYAPCGALTKLARISFDLAFAKKNSKYKLNILMGHYKNSYPIWIYTKKEINCPACIYETEGIDEKAIRILEEGGKVFLAPPSKREHIPNSIRGQFSTDFWSVGTFSRQEGGMGQLIDEDHPLFDDFPTEFHTNHQWYIMASQLAFILPEGIKSIVTEMDSYAYLRNMGQLVECNCLNGKLMISSMGLKENLEYPEVRALLNSIYEYMESDKFRPEQSIEIDEIKKMIV